MVRQCQSLPPPPPPRPIAPRPIAPRLAPHELPLTTPNTHHTPIITDHGLGYQFRHYPPRDRRVMAHQKRRRIPTRNTSNKRPKYTQPGTSSSSSSSSDSDSEQSVRNSQKEWKALRILAQTGQGFGLRYLIEWADIDPATGKQWEPSWVGATNASEGLRTIWRAKKAQELQEKKRAAAATRRRTQQQHTQPVLQAQGSQPPGRTQERSAESTEPSSSESEEVVSPDTRQSIATAQGLPTSNVRASVSDQISPQVAIDLRGESFSRSKYELLSEISESQSSQSRTITEEIDQEDSEFFASQPAFRA